MKKFLLSLSLVIGFLVPRAAQAQSFTTQYDTVYATVNGISAVYDYIINTGSTSVTLNWKVIACNFPHDWLGVTQFGICDNQYCYGNNSDMHLWNDTTDVGQTFTSLPYPDTTTRGKFDLSLDLTATTSTGTYYVTINLASVGIGSTSRNITFIISKWPTSVPGVSRTDNISLYPNPASNELNLVYEGLPDVKTIAVYNIIGKVMSVYRVNGTSANLDLENVPSGIYFARLMNAQGDVLATRKFAKQ